MEVGWTVAREHWGKGYAPEAARAACAWAHDELGARHIVSLIAPSNAQSIRVAEKLGETLEGQHTHARLRPARVRHGSAAERFDPADARVHEPHDDDRRDARGSAGAPGGGRRGRRGRQHRRARPGLRGRGGRQRRRGDASPDRGRRGRRGRASRRPSATCARRPRTARTATTPRPTTSATRRARARPTPCQARPTRSRFQTARRTRTKRLPFERASARTASRAPPRSPCG